MAFASAGDSAMAVKIFRSGQRKAPTDKRFPIELAGLAFRGHDFTRAKGLLDQALRLDPDDCYANEFLATIYFLDGNLEAALKYWNRVNKPILQTITSDPQPQLDPALLDRAFTFAPGNVLTPQQLRETRLQLDLLHLYPNYRFDLQARPDGRFDLVFRNTERNGWGDRKLGKMLNLFGRLPFQTITPESYNLNGKGANFVSLYRFDAQKRRLFSSFSAPLRGDPKWRYDMGLDLRKENWDLRYPLGLPDSLRSITVEKAEASVQLESIVFSDWHWTSAVEIADRRFSGAFTADNNVDPAFARDFLQNGLTLKYITQWQGVALHVPEKRFTGSVMARAELGRWWARPVQSFAKLEGGFRAQWLPQARGDDYAFSAQLRAGRTFGAIPLDELSVLGVGVDTDFGLCGHAVVHGGKKGAAPIGRNYLLLNNEWDKNVYSGALFNIKLGPLFDIGRVSDPSPALSPVPWLADAGAKINVRLFDRFGFSISYGRGLTDHTKALHVSGSL